MIEIFAIKQIIGSFEMKQYEVVLNYISPFAPKLLHHWSGSQYFPLCLLSLQLYSFTLFTPALPVKCLPPTSNLKLPKYWLTNGDRKKKRTLLKRNKLTFFL